MHPEDATAAAECGADAIGIICYGQAGRYVPPPQARELVRALPAFVTPVGVFVNESAARVREVAAEVGLRHVQLHGDERPEMVAELEGLAVIKAVQVDDLLAERVRLWTLSGQVMPQLRGLLFDSAGGGSGIENDWEAIAAVRGKMGDADGGMLPLIVAGGLAPQNVRRVVQSLRPWAVDASSGVELERGRKSRELIGAFIAAVRTADASVDANPAVD
jgi:phosphoribosylanthranilate isomerase